MKEVGEDGVITVEESQSFGMEIETVKGMRFDKGYVSPYMVTNAERMESEYQDAMILITDKKISSLEDILPLLEEVGLKLENASLEDLGHARKVIATKENTTIVEGKGEESMVKDRVAQIKKLIEQTDSEFDREKLQERLAKLAGGVAVIRVGAATETEMKEVKHRIEDAVGATKAAVEEGVVPGG